jgi:SAM-dependent methyltransferase
MVKKSLAPAILMSILLVSTGVRADITDGLIAYWPMDENAGGAVYDMSGNGHKGTIHGNPLWVRGKFGSALAFDGTGSWSDGDYVLIPQDASLMPTDAMSVSAWAYLPANGAFAGIVENSHDSGSTESGWGMIRDTEWHWYDSSDYFFYIVAPGPSGFVGRGETTSAGWHHMVATWDGAYFRVYIDGVEDPGCPVTLTGPLDWDPVPTEMTIGCYHDNDEYYPFEGIIDDVAYWSRALTADEVSTIYNSGGPLGASPRLCATTNPVPRNGSTDVSRDVVLSWKPGAYVTGLSPKHKVFLSEDSDIVNNGIGGITQDANTYTPPELLAWARTYYWRVDEANNTTGWDQGNVWQFTVESFEPFTAGPYVHFAKKGEVTVYYKTIIAVPSAIEYGVKPDLSQIVSDPAVKTEHALTLTNIRPETEYCYRMVADGIASQTYEFYSAFDYGPDPFPGGDCPYPVDSLTPLYEQAAEYILNATGITKGVCIDYGCGRGRLAYEIAKRSDLKIVGFEEDADKVAEGRDYLDKADIYGTHVTILSAPLASLNCRAYSANLIVSDAMIAQGVCPGSSTEIFRVLRPDGGVAFLGQPPDCPNSLSRAGLEDWLAGLGYTISDDSNGLWAKIERGALPGVGEWTHYYANLANTANSGETRLQNDMMLLWYGQPGPRYITDRHNRPMSSLYKKGIMVTPGLDRLMAFDAYNGARYWDVAIPDSSRVAILRDCGWIAIADDYVYAVHKGNCVGLELKSGVPTIHLEAPQLVTGQRHNWGCIAVDGNDVYGSGQKDGASLIGHSLAHVYESYWDNKAIATSRYLFAMDRHDANLLWTYQRAGGSAIINPAIAIGDDYIYFIESRNPQAVDDADGRVTGSVLMSGSSEYLVKLDKNTGAEVQARQIDLPFQHVVYLLYAADHNLLIAAGTYIDPGCRYEHYAFNADDLSLAWTSDYYTGGVNTDHGEQDQHPCIVGDTMYSRYYKVDLTSGSIAGFGLARGNCGTQSACATHLLGRNGNPYIYQLPSGSPIRITAETRPGCWINMIPAGGLLLIPESSAGCTCDYPLQTTMVFMPAEDESAPER